MSAPFSTLYLDPGSWDLVVDAAGNIALAAPPYALTQDVASACMTYLGEVYYDDSLGVPWTQQILGKTPPLGIVQGALAAAALTVPFVATAQTVITGFKNREVDGQVQFTTDDGKPFRVAI